MPAHRKASIRELAADAFELGSGVIEGHLHRDASSGRWTVKSTELGDWLTRFEGQDIVLIVASLDDDRPLPLKICRTCATEYRGAGCPRCKEARVRLRGH